MQDVREGRSSWQEPAASTKPAAERVIDARELLGPYREIVIVHAGQRYRLQLTRQNKLILTK